MKRLLPLLALLLLMGQDCEQPENQPVSTYCHGNDYSVWNNVSFGYERDGIAGGLAAILQGDPSGDPRSTVYVAFGSAYCTGVALSSNVVLTAGHCGYAPTTGHTVKRYVRGDDGRIKTEGTYAVRKHVVHPDYLKWVASGNRDFEARKADLMLLFLEDELPAESLTLGGYYNEGFAQYCNGLVAQGFGRNESPNTDLRETKYVITMATDKYLISRASQVPSGEQAGRICFGDSGGPLYADVGGVPYLAGITTTTMSSDCLTGGTHVRVSAFLDWISETLQAELGDA